MFEPKTLQPQILRILTPFRDHVDDLDDDNDGILDIEDDDDDGDGIRDREVSFGLFLIIFSQ